MATKAQAEHKRYLKRREAASKISIAKGDVWEFSRPVVDIVNCVFGKETMTIEILSNSYQGLFEVLKNGIKTQMTQSEIGSAVLRHKAKKTTSK